MRVRQHDRGANGDRGDGRTRRPPVVRGTGRPIIIWLAIPRNWRWSGGQGYAVRVRAPRLSDKSDSKSRLRLPHSFTSTHAFEKLRRRLHRNAGEIEQIAIPADQNRIGSGCERKQVIVSGVARTRRRRKSGALRYQRFAFEQIDEGCAVAWRYASEELWIPQSRRQLSQQVRIHDEVERTAKPVQQDGG